jgi:hypothetical protein
LRFGLAAPAPGENVQLLSVEEGTFEDGRWTLRRRWNGDQIRSTDSTSPNRSS